MANRGVVRGRRMEKDWVRIANDQLLPVADSVLLAQGFAPTRSATVLRMLGSYTLVPLGAGAFAANDEAIITGAIGVVSSDAFAAGAASMPDPVDDAGYPWLFWKSTTVHLQGTTVDDLNGPSAVARIDFDIKSMRKMKAAETLAFIFQYSNASGAPPYVIAIADTRVLLGGL